VDVAEAADEAAGRRESGAVGQLGSPPALSWPVP
jgi:hypothetical protein